MILETFRQKLTTDPSGRAVWERVASNEDFPEDKTALLVCDMWDRHWSRGATERVDEMAPRMNAVLEAARGRGMAVVHCPSDTMDFYASSPARRRAIEAPPVSPPQEYEPYAEEPALPVDDADEGSDTGETTPFKAWRRQHPAIRIDEGRDAVTDDGQELLNFAAAKGIGRFIIMGVHTNMCVLHRSFGIQQLVRWRMPVYLARDLTDAMYNPARPPYVSHGEGTRLVVEYIEKFWCPTVSGEQIRKGTYKQWRR